MSMDQINFRPRPVLHNGRQDGDGFIDLDKLWGAFVRRLGAILACVMIAVTLAGLYLFTAQPVYTAMTHVLLDDNLARFRSEEHTSDILSLMRNSYDDSCLKTIKEAL